jgi:hypothetical protein
MLARQQSERGAWLLVQYSAVCYWQQCTKHRLHPPTHPPIHPSRQQLTTNPWCPALPVPAGRTSAAAL